MTKRKTASKPADKPRILVVHGPNLNLLGTREPEHYGRMTLSDINVELARLAEAAGVELEAFQSNHEGALIERIHAAREQGVRAIAIGHRGNIDIGLELAQSLNKSLPNQGMIFDNKQFDHHYRYDHASVTNYSNWQFSKQCQRNLDRNHPTT